MKLAAVAGGLALAFLAAGLALAAPKFPPLTGRVVDEAKVLSASQEARLSERLAALERDTGRQLVVATLPSLQGYEIEEYGYQLGRAWGLGEAKRDDGALLIVAPKERAVRIEVGYGLEGVLTDAVSSQIVQSKILPRFRDGDLPGGIEAGEAAIEKQLRLDPAAAQAAAQAATAKGVKRKSGGSGLGGFIFLMVLFFVILPMIFRRRGRRRSGLDGWVAPLIVGSMIGRGGRGGGGFGGGGSFGGGGGFSGGGGSFGGGGASGHW